MQRIEAQIMIPGRGDPVPDAVVITDGSAITYAGPAAEAPDSPGATVTPAHAVLPGLWDCHAHFMGVRAMDPTRIVQEPIALRAARATADLRAALDAGVTSVREMGGLGVALARAIEEGIVTGPNVYAAGAVLSTTGGHGDLHQFPLPWVDDHARTSTDLRLADGPADFARAVREQLRRGAKVIKVCASGGILSQADDPAHQLITAAELAAVVEVAGMADRAVAAHCHGKPGMLAALEAGVRTIEHGTYLDAECADAIRECGAVLVPTRTILAELVDSRVLPHYAQAKLEAIMDTHAAAVALAREHGVTVAMGTDLAITGRDQPAAWGRNGRELALLGEAGLTPLEAIEAATATGPDTLGPQAPRSGQLRPGYDADVITMDVDPLTDLKAFADPARITGVWKAGQRVKG